MKFVVIIMMGLFSCTSEKIDTIKLPKEIKEIQDHETYIVHSLNEVGGDEFRPPYLECIEETLFGEEVKEQWGFRDLIIGKCLIEEAKFNGQLYHYTGYCLRLKAHIYRSNRDKSESINPQLIKDNCGIEQEHSSTH